MGACVSRTSEESELAKQVLGSMKARNTKEVRRLSALGAPEGQVWVTRQTSDIRKVFKFGPQINKGQFGVIHVVTNAAGEKFACKQISKRKLPGASAVRDIRREIEIMHHLRGHPNVITFHGAYEDANDVYLVMELCTGGDLFERIESTATITERSAAALFRDLVETVSYCHMLGVLHRDLKPENFLITDHSPEARIKLADFGLSCFFTEGQEFGELVGSAYYMAPEVIRRQYGKGCDVWSLGVILHILLSGLPPFTGSSDADILQAVRKQEVDLTTKPWPSISRHARHLVSKMLEKDPDKRIRLDQVLTHPWLRTDGTAPPRALQGGVRDRISHFRALNIFKREAKRVLASVLPPEEVSGLKLLFEELDSDRDGLLSLEELRQGLARKGEELQGDDAVFLLKAADLNCDGFIDYREFVAATYTLGRMQQGDVMLKAFRHFDVNGDGYITKDELASALSKVLPPHSTTLGAAGGGGSGRDAAASVGQLLAEADTDRDGRIDYREFCAMLLAGPHAGLDGVEVTESVLPPQPGGVTVTRGSRSEEVLPADLPGLVDEAQPQCRRSVAGIGVGSGDKGPQGGPGGGAGAGGGGGVLRASASTLSSVPSSKGGARMSGSVHGSQSRGPGPGWSTVPPPPSPPPPTAPAAAVGLALSRVDSTDDAALDSDDLGLLTASAPMATASPRLTASRSGGGGSGGSSTGFETSVRAGVPYSGFGMVSVR